MPHEDAVAQLCMYVLFKRYIARIPYVCERQQFASSTLVNMNKKIIEFAAIQKALKCALLPVFVTHTVNCMAIENQQQSLKCHFFFAEHRLKHKHHPFEWRVFQKKSVTWIGLYILSLHCIQFIQVHSVYSHGLPLCEKRWILLDYKSQGCRGAKCLQLHSVLAFKEWENGTLAAGLSLIVLLSIVSQATAQENQVSFELAACKKQMTRPLSCLIVWCDTDTPSYLFVPPT